MRHFERIRSRLFRAPVVLDPAEAPSLEGAADLEVVPPTDPLEEFASLELDDPLGLPRIVSRRAGVYHITDSRGRGLGTIRGDYGIGFTVQFGRTSGWYKSLDEAEVAIATEAVGRPAGRRSAAS